MLEDYKNALKGGQRAVPVWARGQSPYLAVLDDILVNVNIVAQEPRWAFSGAPGGKHRRNKDQRPSHRLCTELLCPAGAGHRVCSQVVEPLRCAFGRRDPHPIIAYEFLNKFYVQEGNKRVSVLKYFDAVRIAGTVTRLIPERNDSLENRIYYEFLGFLQALKVNDVHFSRLGVTQNCRRWCARPAVKAGRMMTG